MRLASAEVTAIKAAAREAFGEDAVVRLFGSRVHDHLRGGDIDLLVEVDAIKDERRQKAAFEDEFWRLTEPRKIDLLVSVRGCTPSPFESIALRDGIVL